MWIENALSDVRVEATTVHNPYYVAWSGPAARSKTQFRSDMPQLLDLANEILYEIIAAIWPDDIEHFTAACPSLSTLMQPTLKNHEMVRKRFGKLNLVDWGDVYEEHPMKFLDLVLRNPRLANNEFQTGQHDIPTRVKPVVNKFNLPDETKLEILESISPDDIINFVLASKVLHRVAKDSLTLHRQRVKTYQNIVLCSCHRHPEEHPLVLVREVLEDWKIAYYVKSIEIKWCGYDSEVREWRQGADQDQGLHVQLDIAIIQSLYDSFHMQLRERLVKMFHLADYMVGKILEETRQGYRPMALCLLSVLLPNLESISFHECDYQPLELVEFSTLISMSQLPTTEARPNSLSKLSEVRVTGWREGNLNRVSGDDFWAFGPFLQVPSVRSLIGTGVLDCRFCRLDDPPKPPVADITNLAFHDSSISARSFSALFEGIKSVKRFTYERNDELGYQDLGAEAGKIIDGLLKQAGSTLEYLALTGATGLQLWEGKGENKGCLKGFTVLKEFRLPASLYMGTEWEYDEADTDLDIDGWRQQGPYLANIMPTAIERVGLDGPVTMVDVDILLTDLDHCKLQDFPNLEKISFHDARAENTRMQWIAEFWKTDLRRVGMSLDLGEGIGSGYCPI